MARPALHAALVAALGEGAVVEGAPTTDISGHPVGRPALRVRVADTAGAQAVVRLCRAHRTPVAAAGRASAYWRPLDLEGAVVVELPAGLDRVDGAWFAGAGWAVRPLDAALRARGSHLPLHPDAFGDTTLGALVAGACTSGIGMGLASTGTMLGGVEVVTGTGEVLVTGAGARTGVAPFWREGFPDLTGLFLGADGGLGLITRLALLHRPPPWRVHLAARVSEAALAAVLALARGTAGAWDTFRLLRPLPGPEGWALDVAVVSSFSAREAAERALELTRRLGAAGVWGVSMRAESGAARAGKDPDHAARWTQEAGGLDAFRARARIAGLDVNTAWDTLPPVLALAQQLVTAQLGAGVPETRLALYLAPDFVNLGVHATLPHASCAWSDAEAAPWFERFAALPVVPYRLGRTWPAAMLDQMAPTRAAWRALAAELDPDALFARSHPLWTR